MKIYNFGENEIELFRDYLSFRSQYVSIKGKNSEMSVVENGVPQGSVLGSIIFTIYVNELPQVLMREYDCEDEAHMNQEQLFTNNCHRCRMTNCYADDATIVTMSNSRDENLKTVEENLGRMDSFLKMNGLMMNVGKTTIVESMMKQKRSLLRGNPPSIEVEDIDGEQKTVHAERYTRVLGCNIPHNLSWGAHLWDGEKPVLKELRERLGTIKYLSHQLLRSCRKTLVEGLIWSRVTNLIEIWGGAPPKYMKKLQAVINNAARFITGEGKRTR